jgi:hypothetical protein
MGKIILDASALTKLESIFYPVEVCDAAGKVLGRFIPTRDISEYEPITPDISEEELNRRERSSEKRYTTAEVLAYLEKL